MDKQRAEFNERVNRLGKRGKGLSNGYIVTVNQDGLIIAKPKKRGPRFPWVGLLAILGFLVFFKAVLILTLGEVTYNDRVDKLRDGNFVEQAGAFAMQPDPLTKFLIWQYRQIMD